MKKVAVAGASGYAGGELLRILASHPELEVVTVTGHSSAGQPLVSQQPHLRSLSHLVLKETTAEVLSGHDVVFFALPHGASGALTAQLTDVGLVVDCGADHRLEHTADWEAYYGGEYHKHWVYGVPELPLSAGLGGGKQRRRLATATKIAAPGCNASTVALSLAPGVNAGLIASDDIVTMLAVGPSGAGKSAKTHLLAAEIMGSATPYAVGGTHRHIPEILQALANSNNAYTVMDLAKAAENGFKQGFGTLSFTPALVPMARGILAVSTAKIAPGVSATQIREAWESCYADEQFVQVLPAGTEPRVADVIGANTCLMSVAVDEKAGRVIVTAALDNLAKGTAGAAVQAANIALGIPEATGLTVNGVAP